MLKVLIHGAHGRMGQTLAGLAGEENAEIADTLDEGDEDRRSGALAAADVLIDFSAPSPSTAIIRMAAESKTPVVIGTTGHSGEQKAEIREASAFIPILWAGNYSVGVTLLLHLVEEAARVLGSRYDAEILELHHRHKKDAPSGTALNLAEAVQEAEEFQNARLEHGREGQTGERSREEIGLHAVRGGEVVGEHTVFMMGPHDRLELTHRAGDRRIFAAGAFRGAHWVVAQPPGIYSMRDVLGLKEKR